MAMDLTRLLLSSIRRADNDYSLIKDGDKIALGLSGGKDSLALLYLLSLYPRYAKKDFHVLPVFIDLGFEWNRAKIGPLKEFCASLGFDLKVEDSTFVYEVLKQNAKDGKHLPCSICSRMKKAAINRVAKEAGCRKVAFAHHSDDALETLLMNMIHGGRVATFEPYMRLERAGITFIRPFLYAKEKDIARFAKEKKLPVTDTCCPANGKTDRQEMKNLLGALIERYPEAEGNLRLALTNYRPFSLYWKRLSYEIADDPSLSLKPLLSEEDIRLTHAAMRKKKETEENYLVYRGFRPVAEISLIRPRSPHNLRFFGLYGEDEALIEGLKELLRIEVKKVNPLKVSLTGRKKVAEGLGLLPTGRKGFYEKTFLSFK